MKQSIPGASMASAALALSQASPVNGVCRRCQRQGVSVVTTAGLCQHCSTKLDAQAQGLTPVNVPISLGTLPTNL